MNFKFNEVKTKVSFKRCAPTEKKRFAHSNCIMPISVGQTIHEGEKFFATLKLINASFKECTLLVDDSIQRHTMKIQSDLDDEALYQMAIQAGDEWLIRNALSYESLTIPYRIMRWDDWRKHSLYTQAYEMITNYYEKQHDYQTAIHENIEEFLLRYTKKSDNQAFDYEKAFGYCVDYLKEECAVMCLWAESDYAYEVYPSSRNKAMTATYDFIIRQAYPGLLKSISLYFEKYAPKIEGAAVST